MSEAGGRKVSVFQLGLADPMDLDSDTFPMSIPVTYFLCHLGRVITSFPALQHPSLSGSKLLMAECRPLAACAGPGGASPEVSMLEWWLVGSAALNHSWEVIPSSPAELVSISLSFTLPENW